MESQISDQNIYRFGDFDADLQYRQLRKHGQKIKLARQPFNVLAVLLENADKVVTREQLRVKLWPDGVSLDFEHGLNKAVNQLRQALGDARRSPRFIETLPCIGYRFIAQVQAGNPATSLRLMPHSGNPRLAVLPFDDLNHDREWEYFSDGLMTEIITHLGRTLSQQLDVIGRNSTMPYKASKNRLAEIAEELQVDYFLTGCVQRDSGRVLVSVELVRVKGYTCVWAESYERELVDVFSIENDLSAGIASAVSSRLRIQNYSGLVIRAPASPQVREAYLKGRYYLNKRTEEDLHKSVSFFKQVIESDPSYALAYTGLAESYLSLESWGELCGSEALPLVRSAAEKALDLEPGLAEAHATLAWFKFAYEKDWADSDRESQLAIRFNPNCVLAYHNYAFCLVARGHFNRALEANYHAHELDPLSLYANSLRGWLLLCAGRPDEAIEQCHQAISFEPYYPPSHAWLALAHAAKNNFDEAITESEIARNLSGQLPMFIACSGYCSAASGDSIRADRVLDDLNKIAKERYVSPYWVATIYVALRRSDEAFEWIEKACEDHSSWAPCVNVDPRFDALRQDPRFAALVSRLGLKQSDTIYDRASEASIEERNISFETR